MESACFISAACCRSSLLGSDGSTKCPFRCRMRRGSAELPHEYCPNRPNLEEARGDIPPALFSATRHAAIAHTPTQPTAASPSRAVRPRLDLPRKGKTHYGLHKAIENGQVSCSILQLSTWYS